MRLLADLVLLIHFAYVLFVVAGLVLILAGGVLGWRWVRNPWFRAAHLAAIGFVVIEAWLGAMCPLTTLEAGLRVRAGESPYAPSGFIAHWVQRLLFWDAPAWVFTTLYTLFGALVAASWGWVRPRPFRASREPGTEALR